MKKYGGVAIFLLLQIILFGSLNGNVNVAQQQWKKNVALASGLAVSVYGAIHYMPTLSHQWQSLVTQYPNSVALGITAATFFTAFYIKAQRTIALNKEKPAHEKYSNGDTPQQDALDAGFVSLVLAGEAKTGIIQNCLKDLAADLPQIAREMPKNLMRLQSAIMRDVQQWPSDLAKLFKNLATESTKAGAQAYALWQQLSKEDPIMRTALITTTTGLGVHALWKLYKKVSNERERSWKIDGSVADIKIDAENNKALVALGDGTILSLQTDSAKEPIVKFEPKEKVDAAFLLETTAYAYQHDKKCVLGFVDITQSDSTFTFEDIQAIAFSPNGGHLATVEQRNDKATVVVWHRGADIDIKEKASAELNDGEQVKRMFIFEDRHFVYIVVYAYCGSQLKVYLIKFNHQALVAYDVWSSIRAITDTQFTQMIQHSDYPIGLLFKERNQIFAPTFTHDWGTNSNKLATYTFDYDLKPNSFVPVKTENNHFAYSDYVVIGVNNKNEIVKGCYVIFLGTGQTFYTPVIGQLPKEAHDKPIQKVVIAGGFYYVAVDNGDSTSTLFKCKLKDKFNWVEQKNG